MITKTKVKIDFDILESIRGIAALYVCVAHCRGILWIGGAHYTSIHPVNDWGWNDFLLIGLTMLTRLSTEFVIIFFVLSGFSIAYSLNTKTSALQFAKRRFIRLYPPYVMALVWAGVVLVYIQFAQPEFFTGKYNTLLFDRLKWSLNLFDMDVMLKNLLYIPHVGGLINPFWSLTYEVIFYLLAPLLFLNKKIYYVGSILFYATGLFVDAANFSPFPIIASFIFTYNFYFMIGVLLFDEFDRIVKWFANITIMQFWLIAMTCFFVILGANLFFLDSSSLTYVLSAVLACILILFFLIHKIHIGLLKFIGKFSYTLYITHFATIYLFMSLIFSYTNITPPYIYNPFVFIPAIFFCLLIGFVQYYLIERNTKKILSNLRAKSKPVLKQINQA